MSRATSTAEQLALNTSPAVNSKVYTSYIPNADFVPPKDFVFLSSLQEVPINPKGPTEIPEKTKRDYAKEEYKYKDFLPHVTLTSEPALSPYKQIDVASRADPEKEALFAAIPNRVDMTPNIGTEVRGVQLSQFTAKQKDELALYAAERGMVVFRNQDFVDQGIEWVKAFGTYFGRLHAHQWGPHPEGHPDLDVGYRDSDKDSYFDNQAEGALNTVTWHTDISYEVNPPCTTFLCFLNGPERGGDTLYANCMTAYDRLSPPMQQFLEGLSVVHSGTAQSLLAVKTSLPRRPTIDTVHPVVRKHPVTGRKALWVNKLHTDRIVGVKKPESDLILNFLYDHIHRGIDL
ncbi:MAG: hypothetical protein M1820_002962 [Bogoriella megaspora]|nr:MAG: hypothetical protein M1820_002962 [Bogoriella megaspora]